MKKCMIAKMRLAVNKLMTEVRDNTLKILENNTLADIAFLITIKELSRHYRRVQAN
jgi:DNA-binding IscR family transcriptional regulator